MIKGTFYRLPEKKRERIIKAIMQEFSGAESDKVSINHIIKEANISRGSFYQYFDDKIDLVEVVLRTFLDIVREKPSAPSAYRAEAFSMYSASCLIFWRIWAGKSLRKVFSKI